MSSTLSIKVSEKEKLRLKRLALEQNKTPSQLMREALNLIIENPEISSRDSCFAVAEDLFPYQVKKLPTDLASNKKHLKGFGK